MRRAAGVAGWALLAIALALLVLAVWAAIAARSVLEHGEAVKTELGEVKEALTGDGDGLPSPDLATARSAADAADEHARRAESFANALPLTLAGFLPVVGDHVRAVSDLTRGVRVATSEALPPLLDVAAVVSPEALAVGERIDLEALRAAAPDAAAASAAAQRAMQQVEGIESGHLDPRLRGAVVDARDGLSDLTESARLLDEALSVLPGALGADEPQQYLLGFQNLAEARPTGGIIGAWALLELDQGDAELLDVGVNDDLEDLTGPVRDLGPEVTALYGADLSRSQNVNLSPHFPHAAVLLSDLWEDQGRPAPDGVVAIDPVALAEILEVTGPVKVSGGPAIDAESVVDVVQAGAYEEFEDDRSGRLVYLAALTASVFDAATEHGLMTPAMLEAMAASARERHIQMWAADERLQSLAERAGVAGVLPEPDDDVVRLHVTNVDASKLDHYLRLDVTCDARSVVVHLTSRAPARVPEYVDNNLPDAEPTTHRVVLDLLLPPERGVERLHVAGAPVNLAAAPLMGWTVARAALDVPRDQTVEVHWELSGAERVPTAVVQPMTRDAKTKGCTGGDES